MTLKFYISFNTHLFVCLIFSWQLLLCVHRHEKELQNTQKINVSTEIKTPLQVWTCFMLLPSSSEQESRTQIIYPILSDHLTHTELKCAKLSPDQHSLLWGDTWRSSRPVNLIHHGIQRKRELSVWRDPTQKISIYIQDRAKRKVSS